MSKRPKEVYGKKLIYHYSAPVIFTLLFSLLAIAAFTLTLFLPYIHGEPDLNGMHFAMYIVHIFTGEANAEIDFYVDNIVNVVFDGFGPLIPAVQVIMLLLTFDLFVMGIFAVILAITSLVMIFSGRLKHWKLPYRCIAGMFWPGLFFYGTIIGVNIYGALIKHATYYDCLYAYIFLGLLFVGTIVTHIIYAKAFRGHVYVKNQRTLNMYIEEYEREHVVVDTTTPKEVEQMPVEAPKPEAPKIVLTPSDDQKEKNDSSNNGKKLPRGLKHIGGHAFSQNTALEEADIPLGIEVLGAGAFANCVNLKVVHIPESVKKIEYNCFFNCIRLERITYGGSREMWKRVKRGSNWLTAAGTKFVVCRDGALAVNPEK